MKFRRFDENNFESRAENAKMWKLLLSGALAGLANGWFGAGGGLVLAPLLSGWIKLPEKHALATSLAVMVPLSLVSFGILWLRGGIAIGFAWCYLLGGVVGGTLAGTVFQRLPAVWLRRIFGLFLLYGGVRAVLLL